MSDEKKKIENVNEPPAVYGGTKFKVFSSFEEAEREEMIRSASLSGIERLVEMRKMINTAYGMHGYDPANLPSSHHLKIVGRIPWA